MLAMLERAYDMQSDDFSNKAEAFEAFDDIPLSPENESTIGAVIARRTAGVTCSRVRWASRPRPRCSVRPR
jgi:hypothetical protein